MIHRFLGWLRHLAAAEYWRGRALRAETELRAEIERNREREDTFVSASVLGAKGMYGLAPRAPSRQIAPPITSNDPLAGLTGAERLEFQTLWLPDAMRANISERQALQQFRLELASRKSINDGGYQ